MRMYDIIRKKRDGGELTKQEINFFIDGYVKGEIPDYQASALLMASAEPAVASAARLRKSLLETILCCFVLVLNNLLLFLVLHCFGRCAESGAPRLVTYSYSRRCGPRC